MRDSLMDRWWPLALSGALIAAGCAYSTTPDRPAPTRQEVADLANSAEAAAARGSAALYADEKITKIAATVPGLKPVAAGLADWCVVGGHGERGQPDVYRLGCDRSVTAAFSTNGDLLTLLGQIDAAAKNAGGAPDRPLENVQHYYRNHGKTPEGLLLPCPSPGYSLDRPLGTNQGREDLWYRGQLWDLSILWVDNQAEVPSHCRSLHSSPAPELSAAFGGSGNSPYWLARRQIDTDALLSGLDDRFLIQFGVSGSYHTAPWT
ncbi:hypothetical protein [Allorhizocola rhizosphaerae]|uniref:hypothetical protein n=1 Tax=Allorhizocola rhizosphaerae TaxID=1872709 RepID=UPI0013C2CB2F|nr:hypothetical protein [Allorhizocola rhizosphaerae]